MRLSLPSMVSTTKTSMADVSGLTQRTLSPLVEEEVVVVVIILVTAVVVIIKVEVVTAAVVVVTVEAVGDLDHRSL